MPTVKEMEYYELEADVNIFLPALNDDDDETELLPTILKRHVKNSSVFIQSSVNWLCE